MLKRRKIYWFEAIFAFFVCLLASICLASARYSGGTGTAEDQYQIATAQATTTFTLHVRAYIDGGSQLIIKGNTAYWHHTGCYAPGRTGGHNDPTYINRIAWYPSWPDIPDERNRDCNCDSSVFTGVTPALPAQNQAVTLNIIQARYNVSIVQQPSASNNYTLIVDFDDGPPGGADWYEVELSATPKFIMEGDSIWVTMSKNGSPTPFNLTLHATDQDNNTFTWSISSPASHGTANASGTGNSKSIGYIPETDYIGSDSFVVQVSDGNDGTDFITVNVIIQENTSGFDIVASGLWGPFNMAFDASGNLYVANEEDIGVSRITQDGTISTFATEFTGASGIAFNSAGTLFVSDDSSNVYRVNNRGQKTVYIAGSVGLNNPNAIAFDSLDNLYVVSSGGFVSKFDASGGLIALNLASGLFCPQGIVVDNAAGTIFVSEMNGNISQIDMNTGNTQLYAQTGVFTEGGLTADNAGNLYLSAFDQGIVLRIEATTKLVSNCLSGLESPRGLAFDSQGRLYVTEYDRGDIVRVDGCKPTPSTNATIYTNPTAFELATNGLGAPTVIDFEDIDASPVNNTHVGRDEFNGSFYANKGITFSNANGYPLFISPGGLFWNASNSLSVGAFPFDYWGIFHVDDDLSVTLNPPCTSVGFTFVDNYTRFEDEVVQFIDSNGNVIAQVGFPSDFTPYRAFLGIVSPGQAVAMINIVEAPDDGDDVNYDDFIYFPAAPINPIEPTTCSKSTLAIPSP